MTRVGLRGMRRRIIDYDPSLGIGPMQFVISVAGFAVAFSVAIMLFNLIRSARRGPVAECNPWRSRSPEWQIPSPIPEVAYPEPLVVIGEPYDYGLPDSQYVATPATAPAGE
jgi:cytochrome c oxidase subunit 1